MSIPHDSRFQSHAEAIGFVCMDWTGLELLVDTILAHQLGLELFGAEPHIVCVNSGFGDKLSMIKALAVTKHNDPKWVEDFVTLVNTIDQEIRPRRNRVVHDAWLAGSDGKVYRAQGFTRVKRTQAHQPLSLHAEERTEMTATEIQQISVDITKAAHHLFTLMTSWPGWTDAMERNTSSTTR